MDRGRKESRSGLETTMRRQKTGEYRFQLFNIPRGYLHCH